MRFTSTDRTLLTRDDIRQILGIFSRTFAALADVFTIPPDTPTCPPQIQQDVAIAFQGGPPPEGFRDDPGEQFAETAYTQARANIDTGMTLERAGHILTFLSLLGWDGDGEAILADKEQYSKLHCNVCNSGRYATDSKTPHIECPCCGRYILDDGGWAAQECHKIRQQRTRGENPKWYNCCWATPKTMPEEFTRKTGDC